MYGSARPSYVKRLDTVHNQGLRLCLGSFRTSPVQSLYVEVNGPPLGMGRTRLSLQYCVKLVSNDVRPAYLSVFQSDIVATCDAKERAIKPLGLGIERHLDEVYFHTHVIAPYSVMRAPQWKLVEPTVCFDLCKCRKSEADPTLYRLHYSELLESFTECTHVLLMDLRMAIGQLRLLSVSLLSSHGVCLTGRQFLLLSWWPWCLFCVIWGLPLRTMGLLFLVTLNLRCRPCCPSKIFPPFKLL